jgi:hypothetical protein
MQAPPAGSSIPAMFFVAAFSFAANDRFDNPDLAHTLSALLASALLNLRHQFDRQ